MRKIFSSLKLSQGRKIVLTALSTGRDANLAPLTVAVLDVGGHVVCLEREDGSGIMRADIAIAKAWGALGMGMSSREIGDRLQDKPTFLGALASVSQGRFGPVPGGVLVCNDKGEVIGAVGISGDVSDQDEFCAIEGIKAAGLVPDPE
ncbi:MAG: heme-binding protein [Pseudomonadota bacterium]|nr:heme-binding protein [Pseudomonadota bacterium]